MVYDAERRQAGVYRLEKERIGGSLDPSYSISC
jgi:hypothetical protein